jgi:hypothetical protein
MTHNPPTAGEQRVVDLFAERGIGPERFDVYEEGDHLGISARAAGPLAVPGDVMWQVRELAGAGRSPVCRKHWDMGWPALDACEATARFTADCTETDEADRLTDDELQLLRDLMLQRAIGRGGNGWLKIHLDDLIKVNVALDELHALRQTRTS